MLKQECDDETTNLVEDCRVAVGRKLAVVLLLEFFQHCITPLRVLGGKILFFARGAGVVQDNEELRYRGKPNLHRVTKKRNNQLIGDPILYLSEPH